MDEPKPSAEPQQQPPAAPKPAPKPAPDAGGPLLVIAVAVIITLALVCAAYYAFSKSH